MMHEVIVTASGAVAGMVAGGVAGLVVSRRRPAATEVPPGQLPLDPFVNDRINDAARQWADAQGMPEAEDLVARKLRLGLALQERRRERRS